MNNTLCIVILLGALIAFYAELVRYDIELRRPRYMKPKSFCKMGDSGDGLLQITAENTVNHHYINDLYMDEQDMETSTENKHNMLCSEE